MKLLSGTIQLSATDLSNHLGCRHLTELNRSLTLGKINKPSWSDPALAVLAKRGDEHEAAYVSHLQTKGYTVENLNGRTWQTTVEAMQRGVDIIVQAELAEEGWIGRSDILFKVNVPSKLGAWSYEVRDTKLSRNTRAGTILQLALYTDMLEKLQGYEPEFMHVVKPGDPFLEEAFRFADFKAYYRLTKKSLVAIMKGEPPATYPEPVAQCDTCRWWKECDTKRHDDDHLSLIASVRSMHIGELQKQEIKTLEQFAKREEPIVGKPERGSKEAYYKIHGQAKIQLEGRLQKKLLHELLPFEQGRGLSRLPLRSKGDIYFDIEGDPFFDPLGLEYLLGYAFLNEEGKLVYEKVWAMNRMEEKRAFDQFMNFVMARLKKYPDLHIYHFAPYEPSAIKRLTLRHSIHEADLDWLLRAERFVDLYAVIKEGLRASVEHYSLKDLERFTSYTRTVELQAASSARRTVEFGLELNDHGAMTKEILTLVEDYNADDCLATEAVHQWLEKLREELRTKGNDVQRPELKTGEATESTEQLQTRAKSLFEGLTKDLPEDRTNWTDHHKAKWLLANQIDYFRREFKSSWWEFYRVHDMDYDDLFEERKAIAGLSYIGDVALKGKEKLPIHKYSFPFQEVGIEIGKTVHEVKGIEIGTVNAISYEDCTIEIKKTKKSIDIHPVSVHEEEAVTIEPLASSLFDIAESVIFHDMESTGSYRATEALLLRRRPRLASPTNGSLLNENEDAVEGAIRIASQLNKSVLGIQGPPGSGKTHTGAMMILKLAQQGKKIGVTAPSHKVVINLFKKVQELGAKHNIEVALMHKAKEGEDLPDGIENAKSSKHAFQGILDKKIVGGTAWLWANNDARETLDYLFVDEAGQMSLAHVLAASRAAKNLVLLGDPQQLEQPQKAAHPEGADVAALTHLLDGHKTMPDDKGIFLAITRRLHPAITLFTSELFYENRLHSLPGLEKQILQGHEHFSGAGLFFVPSHHSGRQNKSPEEVEIIVKIVHQLTTSAVWTNAKGEKAKLTEKDIVIVAPYNAQVAALAEKLPGFRIGTVDKFQGQEAAVVIYSMTSSSPQDAPRGMNFLYNPNRLNVATSRAQCICILVASEKLLETDCRSVDQMRWTNALCRFKELSK